MVQTVGQEREQYRKLTKPRLPNHTKREDQREAYYYSLILLFVPFQDERSLLLENDTAEEAFLHLLPGDSDCSAYHYRLKKMLRAQANIKKINDARQADGEERTISKEDNELQLMGEARAAMKEMFDMNTNQPDTLSLEQRVAMLNTDQRHVFDKVKAHFLHQKQHEANKSTCNLTYLIHS